MLKTWEEGGSAAGRSQLFSPQAGREVTAMTAAQELANFDLLMM
ncbi:hypothetical protein [Klebsiella pneumoniae]|nr:hypothetical protein [Klebsiella pneumoniae]